MASFLRPLRAKSFVFLIGVSLLMLTACTGNNSIRNTKNMYSNINAVNNISSSKNSNNKNNTSSSHSSLTIVVGGKKDIQSQLLIKMYALLLRHASFTVVERTNVGTDDAVLSAMISGQIDLSPQFMTIGLKKPGLNSIGKAQLDYLQVKQAYEAKYHVTWLEPAPLNSNVYNSAPVVRDSMLKKVPQIALALNKLAPILTVQVSQQLQSQVAKGKSVSVVATQFLQSKKLL